jgi:hypothetical protein
VEKILKHLSGRVMFYALLVMATFAVNEADAIDPLRIDKPTTVVNLKEFIQQVDGRWMFSIQNASETELEFEVQRYPLTDPVAQLLGLETPIQGGFRFIVSDGSEVVSNWYQPDIVAITVPAVSVQSFAVLSDMRHSERLWLWSQGERVKFEGSMRNIWIFIFAAVFALFTVGLIRSFGKETAYCKVLLLDVFGLLSVAILLKLQLFMGASTGSFAFPASFSVLVSSGTVALMLAISSAVTLGVISHIQLLRLRSADRSYWVTARVVVDVVKFITVLLWSVPYFFAIDYEFLAPEIVPMGLSLAASLMLLAIILRPSVAKLSLSTPISTSASMSEPIVQAEPPELLK